MQKFVLVAINPSEMRVSAPDDAPEALALMDRVRAVCTYARGHVIDVRQLGGKYPEPDPRFRVDVGPLRCTFLHVIGPSGERLRQLSIGMAGSRSLKDLPPPVACAVIAKMFGFTGDIFDDYEATPRECECGKLGCETFGITCTQSLATEN